MRNTHLFQPTVDVTAVSQHCYDVLVVGAGPAGSSAAYHLARQGADVLLVDRASFPRNKRCGDAVMPAALEELSLMGLAEQMQERYHPVRSLAVQYYDLPINKSPVDPSDYFNNSYLAPRASFDALLCAHALDTGAAWLDQMTVHAFGWFEQEKAKVHGVYKGMPLQLQARIVIAADGSGSRLARQLRRVLLEQGNTTGALTGPETRMTRSTALRGYYTNVMSLDQLGEALEFYLGAEPGTYYHWIFPMHDGRANVGVIAYMHQLKGQHVKLAKAVVTFLQSERMKGRAINATLQGQLEAAPIWAGMRGTALYGDHLLSIGDAAALVHPLTAEGISSALVSGRLAAETALEALKQKNYSLQALSPYGVALRNRYEALYESLLQTSLPNIS